MLLASSMKLRWLCLCVFLSSLWSAALSSPRPLCPHQSTAVFLSSLRLQCPLSYAPSPAVEVKGDLLDSSLTSKRGNTYTSVLFYSSWCPFSHEARLTFDVLSSMYPQVQHLAVEQSSAMPSLFSRYGINSLPAILLVNQTSRVRYRGSKNLDSLIIFYKKTTGYEPIRYVVTDQSGSLSGKIIIMQPSAGSSTDEILTKEPYLLFSVLFLCLRVVMYVSPRLLGYIKALCKLYGPNLNFEIFGESSQILGRILQMIDLKGVWNKIKLYKSRNLHQSARSAGAWASTLASISFGKTSTSRSPS